VLCNAITCGDDQIARDAFLTESTQETGEIIPILLKGLKCHSSRLVLNILQALLRLLNTDTTFNVQGQQNSVYNKMVESDARTFIEVLTNHPTQGVFDAAQELFEAYNTLDNEFGDNEYVIEDRPMDTNH